ncbi:hypothetical protein ACOME3_003099 [Neoechinorhynchus agilis]
MVYKITSTTRSAWISVTDCLHTFYSVKFCFIASILCTLYYTFGPWAIGEVSDNLYGVVFLWGIFLAGQYTPTDMQYVYGSPHELLLVLHFVHAIELILGYECIQAKNSDEQSATQCIDHAKHHRNNSATGYASKRDIRVIHGNERNADQYIRSHVPAITNPITDLRS